MSDRVSKTQRWLDLIALLLKNRRVPVTVEEIMESVAAYSTAWQKGDEKSRASVRRMFERDKDELRELGIPIESVSYLVNYGLDTIEGYRIDRSDFYLPYLRVLEADEDAPQAIRRPAVELSSADAAIALDALRRIAEVPAFPYADEAQSASISMRVGFRAQRRFRWSVQERPRYWSVSDFCLTRCAAASGRSSAIMASGAESRPIAKLSHTRSSFSGTGTWSGGISVWTRCELSASAGWISPR
jgi:hypothetical protein